MSKQESKFKVGDKVRCVASTVASNGNKIEKGQIYTVCEYDDAFGINKGGHGKMLIALEGMGRGGHSESMFELVPPHFLKKDLKTGMRVITRNGKSWVVFLDSVHGDAIVASSSVGFCWLDSYAETLECTAVPEYDIIEVLGAPAPGFMLDTRHRGESLWNREEITPEQKRIKEIDEQIAALAEERSILYHSVK